MFVCLFVVVQIDYASFGKDFYVEHEDIAKLTDQEVRDLKRKLGLKVSRNPFLSHGHRTISLTLITYAP